MSLLVSVAIPGKKIPTTCDIRSIDCPGGGGKRVIIITELDSNRGPSVTNVSEHIATDVINSKGWAPADCLWVEHYATTPKRDAPATWDGINYTWMLRDGRWVASSPVWSPMSDAAAGRLAGGGAAGNRTVEKFRLPAHQRQQAGGFAPDAGDH